MSYKKQSLEEEVKQDYQDYLDRQDYLSVDKTKIKDGKGKAKTSRNNIRRQIEST